jgi:threonine synthase
LGKAAEPLNSGEGFSIACIGCGRRAESELPDSACRHCGDLLEITMAAKVDRRSLFNGAGPGIWRFSAALPAPVGTPPISLSEGGTPLVELNRAGEKVHLDRLYAKNDGQNPTGSFKDRGMSVVVTRARALGSEALVCASTGNTAASLAAYAARAGARAVVVVPKDGVASGKLSQAFFYGASVFGVRGNFDDALRVVFDLVKKDRRFYLVNSVNPFRIEGQKVVAFEIYEKLGRVPDYVIAPVGNAGNLSAIWKGFRELKAWGIVRSSPRMIGVQAEGAAPLATAFMGHRRYRPWKDPRTAASAIRIGNPVSWKKAMRAIEESGGAAATVSDEEILRAREALGREEGLLVEAASAAPIAALRKLHIPRESTVVCIATGNGLKDIADHPLEQSVKLVEGAGSIATQVSRDLAR